MTDIFDSFLRPPCRNDEVVEVTNPEGITLRVGVRSGAQYIQPRLEGPFGEYFRSALWRAGLRSRRADGHGYVIISDEGYRIEVAVSGEDPGPRYSVWVGTQEILNPPEFGPIEDACTYQFDAADRIRYLELWDDDEDAAALHAECMAKDGKVQTPTLGVRLDWGPGWFRMH